MITTKEAEMIVAMTGKMSVQVSHAEERSLNDVLHLSVKVADERVSVLFNDEKYDYLTYRKEAHRLLDVDQPNNVFLENVENRVTLVAGLALTSLTKGATMTVSSYTNPFHPNEVTLFEVSHADVRAFVETTGPLTDDFDMDYQYAFDVLWFNLPTNFTGYDEIVDQYYMTMV